MNYVDLHEYISWFSVDLETLCYHIGAHTTFMQNARFVWNTQYTNTHTWTKLTYLTYGLSLLWLHIDVDMLEFGWWLMKLSLLDTNRQLLIYWLSILLERMHPCCPHVDRVMRWIQLQLALCNWQVGHDLVMCSLILHCIHGLEDVCDTS